MATEKFCVKCEDAIIVGYDDRITIDPDVLFIAAWNKYVGQNRISYNTKDFFNAVFENPYDAAWAASMNSGRWDWRDRFVLIDDEGRLTSFNDWDDVRSPIDADKIDVDHLIRALSDSAS